MTNSTSISSKVHCKLKISMYQKMPSDPIRRSGKGEHDFFFLITNMPNLWLKEKNKTNKGILWAFIVHKKNVY